MKKIILLILPLLLILCVQVKAQPVTITGVVTDETGAPLAGISVMVKHTRTGVSTDNNGFFSLTVKGPNVILVFSGAGIATKEIAIGIQTKLNIQLQRLVTTGTEVVVTAWGNSRQYRKVDGATASTSVNMQNGLSGKVSGLVISNANGYGVPGINPNKDFEREGYDNITENRFLRATDNPLSTFSIDVDAAAYSNVRRFLNQGQLPPAGAVRIEELINYFHYNYPQPEGNTPFSLTTETTPAPWNPAHKLVMIGLQGKKIPVDNIPASNLTFLIDVSGSMMDANKLPLVKESMKLLVDQLREQDRVSIVVYAGAAGLILSPTSGYEKTKIKDAINSMEAGGSTAGGEGLRLAYKTARENFIKDGNNRIILCTDGDFNVGESSDDAMERLVEQERNTGVYLTVLGFGMGNYQDSKMQKLADKGNGNHAYIDQLSEAKKVLVSEFGGTMFTIAKDVKLQVEFNPALVQGYRLIGYENRVLAKEDFADDKKDAGEMGSGHTVTAIYELIPAGEKSDLLSDNDSLKYQQHATAFSPASFSNELMTVKIRYKKPDSDKSNLLSYPVADTKTTAPVSANMRFASAVAEFGLLLRNSPYKFSASYKQVIEQAGQALGEDTEGFRAEFIQLAETARRLQEVAVANDKGKKGVSAD